jgi:hypothetical protein
MLRGEWARDTRNVEGKGVRGTRNERGTATPEILRGEGVRGTRNIERGGGPWHQKL